MLDRKEHILAEIKRVANLLKRDSISIREFSQNSRVSETVVSHTFGSWNRAIEAAGLTPNPQGVNTIRRTRISDEELLAEITRLTDELGKPPSVAEMTAFGRFSNDPYRRRWGTFAKAKVAAKLLRSAGAEVPRVISAIRPNELRSELAVSKRTLQVGTGPSKNKVRFGAPIDFRGVKHAPLNEQGVVYLFGMVSRELGFLIESIRTGFPDCEGKRCADSKKGHWEQVRIEFEYKSSNFQEHGHSLDGCDIIVCWEHDWPNCPLEVLELTT